MQSLFLKIFFWCWLANILVFSGMFAIISWTKQRPSEDRMSSEFDFMWATYAQNAVDALEEDGEPALRAYLDKLQTATGLQMFLFDEDGQEVLGREAPPNLRELAWQTMQGATPPKSERRERPHMAASATGSSGARYAATAEPHRPGGPGGGPGPHRRPIAPLIAMGVTATVVSYWLTRYVTNPVRRLRTAAQRLASGDLTARVGPGVGARKDAIGELSRDFDFMADRIAALMSAQQRLLRDVSHELRSPLARLNVALGLAAQQAGPDAQEALDEIENEAERLNELIGRLLTLCRLETGPETTERLDVDLAELVNQIAAAADFEARSRNCCVSVVACEDCTVRGSPELLYTAVENVVRNAVCYTAKGSEVEVSLRYQRGVGPDEGKAVIRVRDHGAGVSEAALTEIFRPFYRLADARDSESGGAGLGLAITQRAVRAHGGTVTAANAQGGGLVVEIVLPVFQETPAGNT